MKEYNIKEIEQKIRDFWEKKKIYKFNPKSKKPIYSIDTPPPTLSGEMHIGHACSYSQQDFIIRYKRMKGFNVFYPFGTDDNGLPTERLVEKKRQVKSKEMSREEFIKLCLEFLEQERPKFIQDWKDIGISCDWDLNYSTINAHSRKISQWSFLDLYKKGRVYRKDAPSMFCPECRTGVAQIEVKDKEVDSLLNDIVFRIDSDTTDAEEDLVIATTRPELLPACVAIFYNPKDKRYKKLKGKKAKVPLFNFKVQILEDKRVDVKKGTGIVMCCTFGDMTDVEWQKAYNLTIKTAIDKKGQMTEIAGKYKGLSIKEAREAIIGDLKKESLIAKQKPIKHFLNVHERCGTEIEFIKSKQWFVRYLDLKKELLEWGAKLNWYPKYMKHRYDNWVKGLQWDWLISNQRHFGVSFPVWYCEKCGSVMLAKEEQLPVDPTKDKPIEKCKCGSKNFIPEKDVLNTWFTSSMTPQIAIRLVKDKNVQKKLFPMSLRPQAHEIISFWLFNTLLKSRLHFNKNPWRDVVISGFVTLEGEKMSKSKGNIIRPQEVVGKYGADALRYWAASSKLGEDFDFQEKDVVTGKKFLIKILNATRFVFTNLKNYKPKKPKKLEKIDDLFLDELNNVVFTSTHHFEQYDYSKAKFNIDEFFWKNFCDKYLEIVKNRVYNGTKKEKESAFYTLYNSLLTILKLIAPFMPFITEEIYQTYFRKYEKNKSIHISIWPKSDKKRREKLWEDRSYYELGLIIDRIRQEKSKAKKSVNAEIILTITKEDKLKIKELINDLKSVVNAKEIKEGKFKVEFI